MSRTPAIQDYAVIGNGRSAALISRDGSLDWLCWPRFDSPSLFGAILDQRRGGAWRIAPEGEARIERRYVGDTNVLQTRFHLNSGIVRLTDFMSAASEEQKGKMLWPEHELVRLVECEQGKSSVRIHFDPRPDFGQAKFAIRNAGELGLRIDRGSSLLTLQSDFRLTPAADGGASGLVDLRAGQVVASSLTWT